MSKFKIYSHDKSDPESDLVFICLCNSKEGANYVLDALKYRDTGGNSMNTGLYEYYIKEE